MSDRSADYSRARDQADHELVGLPLRQRLRVYLGGASSCERWIEQRATQILLEQRCGEMLEWWERRKDESRAFDRPDESVCPCRHIAGSDELGQPDPDCEECEGSGEGWPARLAASMTGIALDTRVKLLRAELVADHWRKAYLEWGDQQMPARSFAHSLCCVLSALQGDTSEPTALGVEPESKEGLRLASLAETE